MTNVATGYCKAAVCNPVCAAGFLDCNAGMANDGCEANPQTDVANCGGCGRSCAAVHLAACVAGACSGACNAGFGDCNSNKLADGCEINLNTDVMHCGACPTTCSTNNLTPTCIGGVCGGTCTVGHVNCNNDLSDGCESDPLVDVKNCGGCGNMCSSANVQVAHCAGGLCDSTCLTNFADCNMNKLTDGCEVNIATDPLNCGACAKVCSANHVAAPVCANSVCTSTCSAGFADCNMNIQTDGCECDLSTRVCTAGNRCLLKMGQPCGADPTVCASGVCMAGACT